MTWISANSVTAYGREATFGTKPAAFGGAGGSASPRFIGLTDQTWDAPDIQRTTENIRSFGVGRQFALIKASKHEYVGSIPFTVTNGEFLYYAFGQDSTTGVGPFTHTISTLNSATLPSFTLGLGLARSGNNFLRTFLGGTVDGMTLSLSEASKLNCTLDCSFQTTSDYTTANATLFSQPSVTGQQPMMFYDRNAGVTVLGRTIARVKDFTCSIRNNLKTHYLLGATNQQDPAFFTPGYPDFDLSMTIVPDGHLGADSVYDLLNSTSAETPATCTIPFVRAGNSNDTMTFSFTGGLALRGSHNLNEDGNAIEVDFQVQPGNFTVTVVDSTATYGGL